MKKNPKLTDLTDEMKLHIENIRTIDDEAMEVQKRTVEAAKELSALATEYLDELKALRTKAELGLIDVLVRMMRLDIPPKEIVEAITEAGGEQHPSLSALILN